MIPDTQLEQLPYRRLKVAVLDEELPYPPTSGKRIRTLNLLQRLAERHEIRLLCHRNSAPGEAKVAVEYLRDHGIEPEMVDRAPPPKTTLQGGALFYARLAANLLSPLPYIVTANCSPQLRAAVRRHLQSQATDIWHCEWTPYVQLLDGLPARPIVVAAHNVEATIWQRYFAHERNPLKRWYIKQQWRKVAAFERHAFAFADQIVAVSECDAERIRQEYAARHVDVVDNGVDTEHFQPTQHVRDANTILFLGSLDWRPNIDAVQLLLEQIFPLVRQEMPQARLLIVGRCPPTWLTETASRAANVELYADVPDVCPYLQRCSVMTVPLRIGGGSRLKILESLAAGLPVVSTTVGAEGLALAAGEDYLRADSPAEMAAALIRCLQQPAIAHATAARGRKVVLERYGWERLAQQLEQTWLRTAQPISRALLTA